MTTVAASVADPASKIRHISESLLRQAWDGEREPTDTERVCAFVKQLRAKLGDTAARPAFIFNERGVGYRMPAPGEE